MKCLGGVGLEMELLSRFWYLSDAEFASGISFFSTF